MIARTTDPNESHFAAAALLTSGQLERLEAMALELIRQRPGLTASELEQAAGGIQLHKRLKALERKGLVHRGPSRRSEGSRMLAATWWVGAGCARQTEMF